MVTVLPLVTAMATLLTCRERMASVVSGTGGLREKAVADVAPLTRHKRRVVRPVTMRLSQSLSLLLGGLGFDGQYVIHVEQQGLVATAR